MPGAYSNSYPSSQWCHSSTLSSIVPFPSCLQLSHHQGLYQWVSSTHQVAKYRSFSFSISSSNEYSGLISFKTDWLDLHEVQGTLKSLSSNLYCSAFFIVQLSHPCMTTRKTIALARRTIVGKVMILLFNILSRLVITFIPRFKCLLISCLKSISAVILELPPPNKIHHCFYCFHIYLPWSVGTRCHDLNFLNVEF